MNITEEFDSRLSSESRQFIARVKSFSEVSVAPFAKDWEYSRRAPIEALQQACQAGLASVELPTTFGGLGLPFSAKMRMAEEMSRHDVAFAFALMQHHNALVRIAEAAPASTTSALLPKMLTGELLGCTAMSEPTAGSDFSAISTHAHREGSGWRVTGEKGWIANAAIADVFLTYVQTDATLGNKGIACFIVEVGGPGFVRHDPYELHAAHSIGVGGFSLSNYFVSADKVLYPPGVGFKSAMVGVNRARVHVSAMNAGLLDESLNRALRYGTTRKAFGSSLLEFQGLRWSLVDVATDLEALRLLTYRGAQLIDSGGDAQEAAAFAKKFGSDRALLGVATCMQAMGASGLLASAPLARHLSAAKLLSYTDGSTEMMNERLSRLLRNRVGQTHLHDVNP